MKRNLIFGLLGGAIMLAAGMLTTQLFHAFAPSLRTEFENTNLFRSWSDPLMLLYFFHPFVLGLTLAWIWDKTKAIITADTDIMKGFTFGFSFWFAATLPGMLISYASFPISFLMIVSWTAGALIQFLCLGVLFAKTLK